MAERLDGPSHRGDDLCRFSWDEPAPLLLPIEALCAGGPKLLRELLAKGLIR